MKLQHIPLGGRFEYEGRIFVKTGPLTASSETGGQRIIPRYAVLKPVDAPSPTAPAGKPCPLDAAAVRAAAEAFCNDCATLIDPAAGAEFDALRQRFLSSLD